MPVTTAIGVRPVAVMPFTTPTPTSPSTMMVNRSNRSTIDSLALMLVSRTAQLRQSRTARPTTQPTTTQSQPGSAEAYLAANRPFLEATRQEPGNKWYEHFRSVDDPDTILTLEAFDDAAAGEAHVSSDHFQHYLAENETKPLVAEVPDIIYLDVPDQEGWDKMAEF